VFVVAAYGLGHAVHGPPAGWALALAAVLSNTFVWCGRQARYYSAALAGNAVCGLAIWNACRRGRVSDHLLAGLAVGLLFHVHSLGAVTMAALYVAALPLARRQPRLWLRVLAAGSVGGLLVLPWAAWSGLLDNMAYVPAARRYLDPRMLLWSLPSRNPAMLATAAFGLAWLAVVSAGGHRLGERWRRPILEERAGLCFAVAWLGLSYSVFVAFVPAASYFVERLKLAVAVPGLVLNSLVVAALCRVARPSSRALQVAGVMGLLVLSGQIPPRLAPDRPGKGLADLVGLVRSWRLGPGSRIFASPNHHLVLTYYTGRPVQSVAPVRKEWLDRFTGDLVIIEAPWLEPLAPAEVQEEARLLGRTLGTAEAESRAEDAHRVAIAFDLIASGAQVAPPVPEPDDLGLALVAAVKAKMREGMRRAARSELLGRIASPSSWRDWRHAFFYWFVDPARRAGPGLNYARCRDSAIVHVRPGGFVVFDCRNVREPPLFPAAASAVGQP
jgi:hypothetical protein